MSRRSVVIVGGGIAGLAAAWEASGGTDGPNDVYVQVLDTDPTHGGALRTTEFAGRTIDLGADGFLATRSEVVAFVNELGLGDQLVPIGASGAWIYLDGSLDKIPTGLVLGVPTRWAQVRSVPHLSRRAKLGARRDLTLPKRLRVSGDMSIGDILRVKFGNALVDELIEPMIGGIQAGRVDTLSAAEVFPALLRAAERGGSLMRAIRPPQPSTPPSTPAPLFYSLRHGVGSLPTQLRERLLERGVVFHLGEPVTSLRATPHEPRVWAVETATSLTPADVVIVATPPQVAGSLLGQLSPELRELEFMESASSTMVTFAVRRSTVTLPDTGTGVLVPLQTPFRAGDDSMITTAVTLLDRKWPHLAHDDDVLVRVHTGRIDDRRAQAMSDSDVTSRVTAEMVQLFGAWPVRESIVQRWPEALPQYYVGHREMIDAARSAARAHRVLLAGLAYDGVGVPASVGSGRQAGREALTLLGYR